MSQYLSPFYSHGSLEFSLYEVVLNTIQCVFIIGLCSRKWLVVNRWFLRIVGSAAFNLHFLRVGGIINTTV